MIYKKKLFIYFVLIKQDIRKLINDFSKNVEPNLIQRAKLPKNILPNHRKKISQITENIDIMSEIL